MDATTGEEVRAPNLIDEGNTSRRSTQSQVSDLYGDGQLYGDVAYHCFRESSDMTRLTSYHSTLYQQLICSSCHDYNKHKDKCMRWAMASDSISIEEYTDDPVVYGRVLSMTLAMAKATIKGGWLMKHTQYGL